MRRSLFLLLVLMPLFGLVLAGCESSKKTSAPSTLVPTPTDKPKPGTATQ